MLRLHGAIALPTAGMPLARHHRGRQKIFSKEISEITEISAETSYIWSMTDRDPTDPIGWWRLCGRPLVAYCVASVAAGVTVGLIEAAFASGIRFDRALTMGVAYGLFLSPFIGLLALVPSVIALAIAQTMQLPRGLTDTIAGGLIGAAMIILLSQFLFGASGTGEEIFLETTRYGLAGLAGGYVYWIVNGRPRASNQSRRDAPSLADIEGVFD